MYPILTSFGKKSVEEKKICAHNQAHKLNLGVVWNISRARQFLHLWFVAEFVSIEKRLNVNVSEMESIDFIFTDPLNNIYKNKLNIED